ncbi:uncharacterized protein LOC129412284 isoform X2 [Boleophthalmus pectinirostris]|nr:uncharacterized protein LOC129412284 isoform X2 [Boleophthalmus pectinirostris]
MTQIWMLALLFCCGSVYSAPDVPQSIHMTVPYGQTVVLPCNGSALVGEKDPEVFWEAMGSDVLTIIGGDVIVQERYEGRASVSDPSGVDWSLVLDSVRLSDKDMYECIWRGRRTLSTVWLNVEYPKVDPVLEVYSHNETVTLPCYLDLPRNQRPEDLNVWWEKDGIVLLRREKNMVSIFMDNYLSLYDNESFLQLQNIDKFHLILTQEMIFGDSEYNCWYRTKATEAPRPGIPGTITVILKEAFDIEEFDNSENSTEEGGSALYWTTTFESSEETTTNEIPVLLDTVTLPTEVSTESLPMEAYDETVTTFPDQVSSEFLSVEAEEGTAAVPEEDLPDDPEDSEVSEDSEDSEDSEETVDWSDFPWVRIGLIAGVLLVTAFSLCILGLLHKL